MTPNGNAYVPLSAQANGSTIYVYRTRSSDKEDGRLIADNGVAAQG